MLLVIDSRNRDNITNPSSNFTITLKNSISNISTIRLKEICCDYLPYNVSADLSNNTITYTETDSFASFDIPDGLYSPDDLCLHLSNGLNATSPNNYLYSVLYDSNTFSYTIQSTGLFTIQNIGLGLTIGFNMVMTQANIQVSNKQILNEPNYYYLNISEIKQNVTDNNIMKGTFIFNLKSNPSTEYNGLLCQCITNTNTQLQLQKLTVSISDRNGLNLKLNGNIYFILDIN